jgi:hypothetical protein
MVFHPERFAPPVEVFATVGSWLDRTPAGDTGSTPNRPPRPHDRLELGEGGVPIQETPIHIDQPFGPLFGIRGDPIDAPPSTLCAIFLNAGAVRRIGPNRLWVEVSRRWNARGVPTIRMDLEGIGDADGDPNRYLDVGNFYTPEFGAQVGAILDDLEGRGLGPRFVLIGLCAGAYWAFHTAAADSRVVAALIINPRAMVWDPGLLTRREAAKVQQLLEPGLWSRVIRGEVGASRVFAVSRAVARRAASAAFQAPRRFLREGRVAGSAEIVASRLDALRDLGTRVLLAFSGDEPVLDELRADGILGRLHSWPNVEFKTLPGQDHTLRPIAAQLALHATLEVELDRLLADQASSSAVNHEETAATLA